MHDCPFPLSEWLDKNFSMTWIDALSRLNKENGWDTLAIGSIGPARDERFLRGLHIKFYPKDELWNELLEHLKCKPEILLLNLMDYDSAVARIVEVKKVSPDTKVIFRIHHEPFRLAFLQPGFIKSLRLADLVISPLPLYNSFLNSLLNCDVVSIPFGAKDYFSPDRFLTKSKTNTAVTISKNENPGKNIELVKKLSEFSDKKIQFSVHIDINKDEIAHQFASSSFFSNLASRKQVALESY